LNYLFEISWLIISIANKNKVVNLALKEDNLFFKMMQFDHLNSNDDDGLMSIEDLRALHLRKKKIESDKKARKYILEINQRYRKMNARKSNFFLRNMNPFKKAA
tara:strand:+ start:887 stop:1198 length:312 start_codon:yes stop_codon:yes gene_type:complete